MWQSWLCVKMLAHKSLKLDVSHSAIVMKQIKDRVKKNDMHDFLGKYTFLHDCNGVFLWIKIENIAFLVSNQL